MVQNVALQAPYCFKKRSILYFIRSTKERKTLKRDALIECGSLVYAEDPLPYGNSIPVGDIPFVEMWLKKYYGKTMVPIEAPEILRTREFLGRTYEFMDRDKLPFYEKSRYFVKNVSKPKEFNSSAYGGRVTNPPILYF